MVSSIKPNYAAYTDAEWQREMEQRLPSGSTPKKYLKFTVSLVYNDLRHQLNSKRWPWWSQILPEEPALYLGALPIKKRLFGKVVRNDAEEIQRLGVRAVLSVAEPFETNSRGIVISTVVSQDWKERGIVHLQISTPDFKPVSLENLRKGVEFIHWNRRNHRPTYVHCKGGRGRSFLVVLCYLMHYRGFTAEAARDWIEACRPQAKLEPNKWETAKEYEATFLKESR